MSESPPAVDGLPLLGNTLQFARDAFGFMERCREYGDVVETRIASRRTYTLTHPDHVEHVLQESHERYRKGDLTRSEFEPVVGDGLIIAEGEQWRAQREAVQPAFHGRQIRAYAPAMVDAAAGAAATWTDGEVVDVHGEMTELTLRILVRTLLDAEFDPRVGDAMDAIADHYRPDVLSTYLPDGVPTPHNRRFARAVETVTSVAEAQIEERRNDRREDEEPDLLARLLAAADDPDGPIDDGVVRDALVTMLLAGHETTAIALTFVWYLLAGDPDARERLDAELDAVLDGEPTIDDVSELDYARAIVDEAMRLYPPVNFMLREAAEPDEIGGYDVPAGTLVVLPQWTIHRDPRWWDDPTAFRPERWLDGESDRPEFAYFPFGGGPRRCVGARFATTEAVLALATIAREVRFERTAETSLDLVASMTTRPTGGVPLRVRR